jgi:hypothetical protein
MSSFFDELETQLHAAARGQVAINNANRPTRRSWTRSAAHGIPALLAVGTTIAIAVLALVLIRHHQPNPPRNQPGGTPPAASGPPAFPHLNRAERKEIHYLMKAEGAVFRRDSACSRVPPGGDPGRAPSLSQGSPSAPTLAILGLLRRPAAPSDRLPPRIIGRPGSRHVYPNGTIPPVTGVYVRYIRKARHRFGANYYLAPAENVNWRSPLPERCYSEQATALRQELPQIPPQLRAGALALEPRYLNYLRQTTRPYPGVSLVAINDTGNGDGGSGFSISQIEAGRTLTTGAPSGVPVVYGLAPDGVHTVTFHYKGRPAKTVLVINNVFILHDTRDRLPHNGFPDKLVWRSAAGTVIKTITWR